MTSGNLRGAPDSLHTILRVSNVGGVDVRFDKHRGVLVWDGALMRYREADEKERSQILAWLDDLKKMAESHLPKP